MDPDYLNGDQPEIEGMRCEEMIALQYWYKGKLKEPVNSVSMKFGGRWHRLYFDHSYVFWRSEREKRPVPSIATEIDAEYKLDDIGVTKRINGDTLVALESRLIIDGVEVLFRFEGNKSISFTCVNDHSTYRC